MGRIGVKYCGGCNPRIDRLGLVREVEALLPADCRLTQDRSLNGWDVAILVCGCEVRCANKPAVRNLARRWILVGGPTVDLESVPEERLASEVARKIMELK